MPDQPGRTPPHLSPEQFRALGHRMVDLVADYMGSVSIWPVRSQDSPGDTLARLPERPPESGLGRTPDPAAAWDDVFADVTRVILPGLTHWQHPAFFGYFPCNASGPAILGELLSAGLGVQGMLWQTSPAATELETRILDWCADMLALPDRFRSEGGGGGVIQGTASESTLTAIVAARQRWRRLSRERNLERERTTGEIGLASEAVDQRLAVICSEEAHSSVVKAAMVAGIAEGPDDEERVWRIPADARGRMDVARLRETLETRAADPAAPTPIACVATMGTTGVGAIDPIDEIAGALADSPHARDAWLHVDAAWAGSALVCPEHRAMAAGLEHADSLCINPHKWLLTNFDCDLFWVADRRDLIDAMSVTPEYLRNAASDAGAVIDYRDWHVPLGRRFRALKLWFVIRHYGIDGLRDHIREHVRIAGMIDRFVRHDDRFVPVVPRSLSLVCFRVAGPPERTLQVVERVNASGKAFLSHGAFPGPGGRPLPIARFAIGGAHTREEHARAAWELVKRAADALR